MFEFDTVADTQLIIEHGSIELHIFRHYSGRIIINQYDDGYHTNIPIDGKSIYSVPIINEAFLALRTEECLIRSSPAAIERTLTNILGAAA